MALRNCSYCNHSTWEYVEIHTKTENSNNSVNYERYILCPNCFKKIFDIEVQDLNKKIIGV